MELFFWIVLISIAVIAIILLLLALSEPHRPEFTTIDFKGSKEPNLRVLFFTDLHSDICFIKSDYIINLIRCENPDAVIFGGDITVNMKYFDKGTAFLNQIRDCCRELNIPFYGVTGNHDFYLTPEQEAQAGFDNLENRFEFIEGKDGTKYVLSGVDDSGRDERVWYEPVEVPDGFTHILVVHDPDAVLHFASLEGIDYVLSGHIHGGQVRTPFGLEFIIRNDELPKKGIFAGIHSFGNTKVFISRGIGCSRLPIRLGSRPEVSIIEF